MKTNLTIQNRTEQNRTKEYASFFRLGRFRFLGVVIPCITDSSPGTSHPLREQNRLYCVTYEQLRAIPM